MLQSPASSELRAEWQETRDEEQAVSMLSDGPVHPNVKETLPQATLLDTPATTQDAIEQQIGIYEVLCLSRNIFNNAITLHLQQTLLSKRHL